MERSCVGADLEGADEMGGGASVGAADEPVATRQASDFGELDPQRQRARLQRVLMVGAALLFAAALAYALVFGRPSVRSLSPDSLPGMGGKVLAVTLVDQAALVNVSKAFFTENRAQNLAALCAALRERHVDKALLRMAAAPAAGQVNVRDCKAIALPVDLVSDEARPAGGPPKP